MSQEPHSRPSQDKRVQLEAIFLKSVGESLPREGWVELMCLLVGKPRAADLLKELGDTHEISVSDFLDLIFDKVPASATGMDQNEKPQAAQLGTAQAYEALPAHELHQELPPPFAPELHGELPEVQAAQELGTTNEYAAQPSQELHGESPEVKALKQELEQTKPQLRAAQAKAEEKEQELQRLQKLDTKEQAEAESDEAAPKLPSTEDAEDSARKSSETKLDEVVFKTPSDNVVLLQLAGNHVRLLVDGDLQLEQVELFEIDVAQRTFNIELGQGQFQDEEDVPKIQEQVERLLDRAAALLVKPPAGSSVQAPEASEPGHVELQADREVVLAAVRKNYRALKFASEELQADREVVLAAVAKNYRALQLASQELQGDKDVVLAAVARHEEALQFASQELRGDKDVVLAAVAENGGALQHASQELQGDKDVVLAAVARHGWALQFASQELRSDREFVLAAVARDGRALQFASQELRGDKDVVLAAVARDGGALEYASQELRGDKDVVLAAMAENGGALQFASQELRGDKDVVLAAVARHGNALLQFASQELRGDRGVVLAAMAENGGALQFASQELREDQAFVLEAVEKTRAWFLVNWASPVLREDKDFLQKCKDVCGTGLIFTYYESYTAFKFMRQSFLATGASVPGGQAYERVMEMLHQRGDEGAATVWFDKEPVFGASADDGRWLHPSEECGRDDTPVPPDSPGRHRMWRSKVESSTADSIPEVGSKHPCWCCHWIRKVRERHAAGAVICCTVSNIFWADWVDRYGAGSSELSDERADELNLPRESFKNGRPEGWGCGKITMHGIGGNEFEREAPIHPRTGLPLGQGCRWERQALDGMGFPVYVFFMP